MKNFLVLCLCLSIFCVGCMSAGSHRAEVREDVDRISVANVQREIKVGMAGADVIAVLGSPNMISTDSERREVWVYDKVSTERVYSTSQGGLGLILGGIVGGGSGGGLGAGSSSYSKSAGASSSS